MFYKIADKAIGFTGLVLAILTLGCHSQPTHPITVESSTDAPIDRTTYLTIAPMAPSRVEVAENDTAPTDIATIESIENVYDGDTIQDVRFLICSPCTLENPLLPVHQVDGGIYFLTDIRLRGIDTPEVRVSTKWKGKERSEASRERERELAYQARDYLRYLLTDAEKVLIKNQEEDKYYGRIVADIFIEKSGKTLNAAKQLIDCGLAVNYDGGTKTFYWGAEGIQPTCKVPE